MIVSMIAAIMPVITMSPMSITVAIISVPVIGIMIITAIANYHLIVAAPVTCITVAVYIIMHPWVTAINYHLVAMI